MSDENEEKGLFDIAKERLLDMVFEPVKREREAKEPKQIRVARNSDNTYNDYIVPVIFIPGVFGSRLKFRSGYVWDPDSAWAMKHWLWTNADEQRVQMRCESFDFDADPNIVMSENTTQDYKNVLSPEEVKRGWAGVSYKYHGKFLEFGINNGYYSEHHHPIYAFGYDWRDSNEKSGDAFKKRIEEILKIHDAKKCVVVSHSMGGLVTRAALFNAPELIDKVLTVVHVFQPAIGTPVPYRRMFTGCTMKYDGGIGAAGFNLIVGNTGEKWVKVASVCDGAMQLMPANNYPKVGEQPWLRYMTEDGAEKIDNLNIYGSYLHHKQPPGIISKLMVQKDPSGKTELIRRELKMRLEMARDFHRALQLGGGKLFKHPLTFSLYGRGLKTDIITEFEKPTGFGGFLARNNPLDFAIGSYVVGEDGFILKMTEQQQPLDGGDATVAEHSSSSIFPDQQLIEPPRGWKEIGSRDGKDGIRQYVFHGVEHSMAANHEGVNKTVSDIVHRILRAFGKIPE